MVGQGRCGDKQGRAGAGQGRQGKGNTVKKI